MCLFICMFTCDIAFSSVVDGKGRENLFVEEKGQNADPEYLKFSWKGNRLFAYFCIDKVTFVVQEVTYVDNEASIDARRKGNVNEAMKLSAVTEVHSFDMKFLNSSSSVKVSGQDEQPATFDYYLENCPQGILGAKSYSKILYSNIYPNVDLEFYIDGNRIKYDFVVHSGGSASDIKIEWDGVENLDLTNEGIKFNVGSFLFSDMLPVSFCGEEEVETKYIVEENTVKFSVADYDAANTLLIDPGITWSSHLEYNGYGTWGDIVHNSDGNYFYYADWEWSPTAADVSNYLNSASSNNHYGTAGGHDIIISKFKFSGDLVWVCQYGGDSNDDIDGAVMYDEQNERLYVAGNTNSSGFPLQNRSGAYNLTWSNATNGSYTFTTSGTRGFLLMFDANNSRQWATLLDRGINLETYDMAVNSSGSVFLIGKMGSVSYRDYTRYGSQLAQIPYGSGYQGNFVYGSSESQTYSYSYIIEFASSGAMLWSTYLPVQTLATGTYDSNTSGRVCDIEIDADGSLYIVGDELWSGNKYRFSTALITATYTNRGQDDMFYMKFNSNNQPVPAWGGYIGGAGFDKINVGAANGDIELDSQKRLYVTGHTYSADFPHVSPPDDCGYYRDVISGSVNNNVSGTQDGYIFRINTNPNGTSTVDYSTYFGGDGYTAMKRIYKDLADNLWICGEQNASAMSAIPVDGYYNAGFSGTQSTFFAQLSQYNEFIWLSYYGPSTYYGGFETYSPDNDHIYLYYAGNSQNHTNIGGGYQYSYSGSGSCTRAMVIQHDVVSGIEPTIVLPSGVSCNVNTITVSGNLPAGASWHWYTGSCGGTEITAGLSGVNNSTLDISSYPAGTTFYVQAEGQCLVSSCAEYTKQESVSIASTSFVEPSCHGECDGSITVTVDGGIAPYTYLWSNNTSETTNETSAQLVGLCAGAYSVTVRDANGCESAGARETTTECFRITDILYNSCDFTAEGFNEMVTLLIGPNDLDASAMNINWSTSELSFTGFCENASIVSGINASITGGGRVIAPTGGILPANSEVLIVTSSRFDYTHFDFSGLDHDVYILFQCNTTIEQGHFGNSTTATRNFSISFGSSSCSDAVSYRPPTTDEGNAVHYNADGTVEYYNNGCQAPVFFEELVIPDPDEISLSYPAISGYQDVEIGVASPVTNCGGNSTYSATGLPTGLTIDQSTGVISGTPSAQSSGNIEVTLSCGGCDATYIVGYTITEQPDLSGCIIEEDFSEITTGTQASPGGTELSAGYISDFPTTSKAYPAGGVVKLGSSSAIGYIQTAALDLSVPFYVEFDVKGWNSAAGNVEVVVSGGQTQTVAYVAGDFQTKHIDFSAATASSTLRISTISASKRAFIDNVRVCYPSSCTMTATARQTSGTCEGNIGIEVEASDGTGELSYSWDNGAGTAAQYNNAVSGTTYNVVVTDEDGCTANASVTPVQTGLPVITPSFSPISCHGGTTSVALNVSGGAGAPYTYQWEGYSSTSNTISGVLTGTYNVTVRDASCSATSSIYVSEPDVVTFDVSSTMQDCDNLGSVTVVNEHGGSGVYSYVWHNSADEVIGSNSDVISDLNAGSYSVTVSDENGCSASTTVSISNCCGFIMTAITVPACDGACNGIMGVSVNAEEYQWYDYFWSDGFVEVGDVPGSDNRPLCPGTYSVTVNTSIGCTASVSATVEDSRLSFTANVSNPDCFGGLGSIDVAGMAWSRVLYYNVEWNNGSAERIRSDNYTIGNLATGNYDVTVTDERGCSATQGGLIVNIPDEITFSVSSTPVVCNTLGSITLENVQGGNGSYSYVWHNSAGEVVGSNSNTISGLNVGNYSVTVSDTNGCSATATMSVGSNPTSVSFNATASSPNCSDGTGSIAVTNIVGTANYAIAWTGGSQEGISANNYTITGLATGNYTVTVADANGCSATQSGLSVEIPTEISYSFSTIDQVCAATGSITIENVTGGVGGYSYVWHNSEGQVVGANSNVLSGVNAGVYNLTVSDANNCEVTDAITLGSSSNSVSFTTVAHDLLCYADGSGRIEVQAITGNSPYSVAWSSASANGIQDNITASQIDITNLPAGNYTIIVTDADECSSTLTTIVEEPALLGASASLVSPVMCFGDKFDITVSADGGSLADGTEYSYHWSNDVDVLSQTGLEDFGTYSVTVTDDNGCIATSSVNVEEPSQVRITISASAILCNGQTSTVTVTGNGGTGVYSGTGTFENVNAGPHTYTIADENGCSASDDITITEPNELGVNFNNIVAQTCETLGSVELLISNAQGNTSYSWDGGSASAYTSATTEHLGTGAHTVSVTDGNGCTATATVDIPNNNGMTLSPNTSQPARCFGESSGSVMIDFVNGTSPYAILWNGNLINETNDYHNFDNLTAGTYEVTVIDADGCSSSTSVEIAQPDEFEATASVISIINCHDETFDISASAQGGNGGYAYMWDGSVAGQSQSGLSEYRNYNVVVTDAEGCTATSSVTPENPQELAITSIVAEAIQCHGGTTVVNAYAGGGSGTLNYTWAAEGISAVNSQQITAPAGTYSLTVTDGNGCWISTTYTIENPDAISISITGSTEQYCTALGEVRLVVGGGTGALSYSWDGNTTNTVSDNSIVSQLSAGTHTLTVTDVNGCSATRPVYIDYAAGMSVSASQPDSVRCFGETNGEFTISMDNGLAPYTIVWNNGTITEYSNVHTFSNLSAGIYGITVTDAHHCMEMISVEVRGPERLVASSSAERILCHGGTADVTVSATGGTLPYQNTGVFNLGVGEYDYQVVDARGCESTTHVSLTEPTSISVNAVAANAQCYGGNGRANLIISGGTNPYSVVWQDNSTGLDNTHIPVNTNFGYTVTDLNGCTYDGTVTVGQPQQLSLDLLATSVSCYGIEDARVEVSQISGGTMPYNYMWSNGNTMNSLVSVGAGTYSLLVTDANGCTISATTVVTQPEALNVSVISSNVECGISNGSLSANVYGGNRPYVYYWSNGGVASVLDNVGAGTYTLTVTDANRCSSTASSQISVAGMLRASIEEQSPVSCFGMTDATLVATAEQAQPPVIYQWNNGQNGSTLFGLGAGMYIVTVTDGWGCQGLADYMLYSPTAMIMSSQVTDAKCSNTSEGAISLTIGGGRPPYSYLWSTGGTEPNLEDLRAGSYGVQVTDMSGCTLQENFVISAPATIRVEADVTDVTCYGKKDGRVEINVTGGVEPYDYGFYIGNTVSHSGRVYEHLRPGVYNISVSDANGCGKSISVAVGQPERLGISPLINFPSCKDLHDATVEIFTTGGTAPFTYTLGTYTSDSSIFINLNPGIYSAVVTDANGCSNEVSEIIVPESELDCLRIPNVITPNGDGVNDEWIIENIEIFPEAHIYVYNRWGQLLYHGRGDGKRWDGSYRGHFVPSGVYMYIIKLESVEETYEGTVTVLY